MTSINVVLTEKATGWLVKHLRDPDIQTEADLGAVATLGVIIDGKCVAAVAFNRFRRLRHGNDVSAVIAATSPRWCKKGVLASIFRFAFGQLGCARMTVIIREGNERSMRMCAGLGFEKEGVIKRGWDGKTNAVVMGMLKQRCRWIDG